MPALERGPAVHRRPANLQVRQEIPGEGGTDGTGYADHGQFPADPGLPDVRDRASRFRE